ncbi:hypothetical protein LP421_28335 [Rhizobium sp. RCAM05350]|nr:hypothetical protein LP421_28335 [Rhizobium sp. RCAM05350]
MTIVAGEETRVSQDQDDSGIYQRVYAVDGTALSGEIQVNRYIDNSQGSPQVAALPDGGG